MATKTLAFLWGVIMGAGIVTILWNTAERSEPIHAQPLSTWVVNDGVCDIYMPHGKRRCVTGEVTMEGY